MYFYLCYLAGEDNEFSLSFINSNIRETIKRTYRMELTNTPMYTLYGWHKHCFTWQADGKLDVCSNSVTHSSILASFLH